MKIPKQAKPTAKKATPVTTANADEASVLDLAGAPLLVERLYAAAMAVAESTVKPLQGSARLACVNVSRGVANVLAERARVERELPSFDLAAAAALPELGLATAWAAEEVLRFSVENPAEIQTMLRRASELRGLLLLSLDGAVRAGFIPAAPVAKLRSGSGGFDTAGDCVGASILFQKYAVVLRGKTPVSAAQIKEAAALGSALLSVMQPKAARGREKADALKAAIDLRDRLGTLLAAGHAELRRAGGWLFGEARDARVPPLLSHAATVRRKPTASAKVA